MIVLVDFHMVHLPKILVILAFVQHMIASLNAEGKLGVVVPHGVLFRGSSEKEIRKGILEDDLLEAVIGLPSCTLLWNGYSCSTSDHQQKET